MTIYPVILCGGRGTRLWPVARSGRPKQFIPLADRFSTFQRTVLRLSDLREAETALVVCGRLHAGWVRRDVAELRSRVHLLLEPERRDSAAAVCAAAAWVAARDPSGVLAITAADHHIPDRRTFAQAILVAAAAAEAGGLVTLGVKPTQASQAYGYIEPGAPLAGEIRTVRRFTEKPALAIAAALVEMGCLWSSGVFVVRADILLEEFAAFAPAVAAAVAEAVAQSVPTPVGELLGGSFASAPRVSFDRAVIEKTSRTQVLPVTFEWSDIGAWDAVYAALPKDAAGNSQFGAARLVEVERSLVHVERGGPAITVIGLSDVAVVGDGRDLLVCNLKHSQRVKNLAASIPSPSAHDRLLRCACDLDRWLRTAALPLWGTIGADPVHGGYHDLIDPMGRPVTGPKRARVQARQSYVFSHAARLGAPGGWSSAADRGISYLRARYRRPDGLFRTMVTASGECLDNDAYLYDQAFVLLSLAAVSRISSEPRRLEAEAIELLQHVRRYMSHPEGGFREAGQHPFQANAHMHLLEAALAWMDAAGEPQWRDLAALLVDFALDRLLDRHSGALHEFFAADWSRHGGPEGGIVEPGHQFEWCWLLNEWDVRVGDARARQAAVRLFEAGRVGFDPSRGLVVDALADLNDIQTESARLWPQAEHLRSALAMARTGDVAHLAEAACAAEALISYLDTPIAGLWRDRQLANGSFVQEPAPASSLYHIMGAAMALAEWAERAASAPSNFDGTAYRWAVHEEPNVEFPAQRVI